MLAEQSQALENSLWAATRAFEERAKLCDSMAERSRANGLHRAAEDMEMRAAEAKKHGDTLRHVLLNGQEFSEAHPTLENHLGLELQERAIAESRREE
jgi:hypothetical protein